MPTEDSATGEVDIAHLHNALVDELKKNNNITKPTVEAAFRAVPRHPFLPDKSIEAVYQDQAIPTKFEDDRAISSSSQPAIMAIMLEQLALQPGHNVLEIGAGTGYNAALMAHLVGENGRVTTIDLDEDTAAAARDHLAAAGYDQVQVVCGDGMDGFAAHAPYDRIILTVGGWEIAPTWLDQLKPDGRILLPLSINGPQFSIAFERTNEYLTSTTIRSCGFMRIRGAQAEPFKFLQLGPDEGLSIFYVEQEEQPRQIDADTVYKWITGSHREQSTKIKVTPEQAWGSIQLWGALHEPQRVNLIAEGEMVSRDLVPFLLGIDSNFPFQMTYGVLDEEGLSVLMRAPSRAQKSKKASQPPPFELFIRSFGPDKSPAHRLQVQVQAWDEAGRPGLENMRIRVYPLTTTYTPIDDEVVIGKRWHQFVINWE